VLYKNWKFILSVSWLIVTIVFALWWLINSLNMLNLNTNLAVEEVKRLRFMLMSEGISWIILLLLGGITLIYFVLKELKKNEETKKFVASFSHDLKTSIASLRLQAESLKEDVKDSESQILIKRLVDDSLRLQVQLENSLEFASENKIKLHMEKVNLKQLINSMRYHWPEINLILDSDEDTIVADRRALDIIMRNIIYNAKVHADAKNINFSVIKKSNKKVIKVLNDGRQFIGNINKLGDLYYRQNPSSGSGLGLYIVTSLMKLMSGDINFSKDPFTIKLIFNEASS